jgi:protein gp37
MTKIEWVRGNGSDGMSWNALRAIRIDENGKRRSANHCEHVNQACAHCYADGLNKRLGGLPFKPGHRKDYTFEIDERKLLEPLRRKKPTRIFCESMSDMFGEWWPDHFIDRLYAVMALCPQHTFINLSKRPERRQKWLSTSAQSDDRLVDVMAEAYDIGGKIKPNGEMWASDAEVISIQDRWPLPNVIEGISVSCQEEADKDVPILLDTLAACRAVSAEPLLESIDFNSWPDRCWLRVTGSDGAATKPRIDWLIVGGEARPMHPQWARDIRDQCQAAGVAFFYKQTGEWAPIEGTPRMVRQGDCFLTEDGRSKILGPDLSAGDLEFLATPLRRVGKKAAGRLLDGREWNEFPPTPLKEG